MPFDGEIQTYTPASPPAVETPVRETEAQRQIRETRALIASPDNWLQGEYSRLNAYCLVGALRQIYSGDPDFGDEGPAERIIFHIVSARGQVGGIEAYNDSATHADVLSLLDEAYGIAGEAIAATEVARA